MILYPKKVPQSTQLRHKSLFSRKSSQFRNYANERTCPRFKYHSLGNAANSIGRYRISNFSFIITYNLSSNEMYPFTTAQFRCLHSGIMLANYNLSIPFQNTTSSKYCFFNKNIGICNSLVRSHNSNLCSKHSFYSTDRHKPFMPIIHNEDLSHVQGNLSTSSTVLPQSTLFNHEDSVDFQVKPNKLRSRQKIYQLIDELVLDANGNKPSYIQMKELLRLTEYSSHQLKALIRYRRSRLFRNPISTEQISAVKDFLIQHRHLYSSCPETLSQKKKKREALHDLRSKIGLDRYIINQIIRQILHPRKFLTRNQKLNILLWCKRNNFKTPTTKELHNLSQDTQIDKQQIISTIWRLRRRFLALKIDGKYYFDLQTLKDRHMSNCQDLLEAQFNNYNLKNESRKSNSQLTKLQIKKIGEFVSDCIRNNIAINRSGIATLSSELKITVKQCQARIRLEVLKHKRRRIDPFDREKIFNIFDECVKDCENGSIIQEAIQVENLKTDQTSNVNVDTFVNLYGNTRLNNRLPSSILNRIYDEYGLSNHQIHELYRQWQNPPQSITEEKKQVVANYLRNLSDVPLRSQDYDELQQQTKLSRTQIIDLKRKFQDPLQVLTNSKKEKIRLWLSENSYEKPTSEELMELQARVQLARRQITRCIREIKLERRKAESIIEEDKSKRI